MFPSGSEGRTGVWKQDGRHPSQKEKHAEARKIQMDFEKTQASQVRVLIYESTKIKHMNY